VLQRFHSTISLPPLLPLPIYLIQPPSHPDRPFTKTTHRPESAIRQSLVDHRDDPEGSEARELAEGEECQISGALACPREKTLRQRGKYFSRINFLTLEDILQKAETEGKV
jgi:hypothetical protein